MKKTCSQIYASFPTTISEHVNTYFKSIMLGHETDGKHMIFCMLVASSNLLLYT
jgi:hypothetical protein